MELGMVGLGRMRDATVQRFLLGGHRVVVYDRSDEGVRLAAGMGMVPAVSVADRISQLAPPRAVWAMAMSGEPTEKTVNAMVETLLLGDAIIDGGDDAGLRGAASYWTDHHDN